MNTKEETQGADPIVVIAGRGETTDRPPNTSSPRAARLACFTCAPNQNHAQHHKCRCYLEALS
jgi:hypothetical protein